MFKTISFVKILTLPVFAVASSYWLYKNTLYNSAVCFETRTPDQELVGTVDYVFDKFLKNKF